MDGLAHTGIRLLVVGGAATLIVPGGEGRTVLEDPGYLPVAFRAAAAASAAQLAASREETRVDWTSLSPPAELTPGIRTGTHRTGTDELLLDDEGRSRISTQDLTVALLDEAERPRHSGRRFTVAY